MNPYVNSVNFIYDCDEIIGYNRDLEVAKLHKDYECIKKLNDQIAQFNNDVVSGEKKLFNGQAIICFEEEESNIINFIIIILVFY